MSLGMINKQHEEEIFELIQRLIQTLQLPEIAIDEIHTSRLHARFLTSLLLQYKRNAATSDRLHAQPLSSREQQFLTDTYHALQMSRQSSSQQVSMGSAPDHSYDKGYSYSSPDIPPNEPMYEPEAACTGESVLVELLDFDSAPVGTDDDLLGSLRILNTPAYWLDMMTPGYALTYMRSAILALIINYLRFQNQWGI
jgi:hypothetical protein